MEGSKKALVPEWLKRANGGAVGGGEGISHHSASLQSDQRPSSYCHRSYGNGAMMHHKNPVRSYGGFGRSLHERGRDKEFGFLSGDHDISDSLTLGSSMEKDTIRHSQSMISGKRGEVWPRRVGIDTSNGLLDDGSIRRNISKAASEWDISSQGVPDLGGILSPGLKSAPRSLSNGTSAVVGCEGWTSVLAAPHVAVGSNSMQTSTQQVSPACSARVAPNNTAGLSMAETLFQTSTRAPITPQLSVETQRLDDLAIKQSRRLIPMTPSMPKTSVPNSTEKPKSKTVRSSELNTVTKVGQRLPLSQLINQTVCGTSRFNVSKASQPGKLTVIKAACEMNNISRTATDGLSLTDAKKVSPVDIQSAVVPSLRSPIKTELANDCKAAAFSVTQNFSMDKRPLYQAQNRIDFFNSLRKKNSENHSATLADSIPAVSSTLKKLDNKLAAVSASANEGKVTPAPGPDLEWAHGNDGIVADNGNSCEGSQIVSDDREDLSSNAISFSDEEERALLRSMGWEENAGEVASPLTEEEISSFYELLKLRQSSKFSRGKQQPKIVPFE